MPASMTSMPTWTPAIRFTVPGVPMGKGRPRFAINKGGVRTYTDAKTRKYEEAVAWHARAMARGRLLAEAGVPVRVDILAEYPRPKRLLTSSSPDGTIPKCVRTHGDLDNHIKACLDSCNGILWADDSQVCIIRAEAVYARKGARPSSTISVFLPLTLASEHHTKPTEKRPCNIGGPSRKH